MQVADMAHEHERNTHAGYAYGYGEDDEDEQGHRGVSNAYGEMDVAGPGEDDWWHMYLQVQLYYYREHHSSCFKYEENLALVWNAHRRMSGKREENKQCLLIIFGTVMVWNEYVLVIDRLNVSSHNHDLQVFIFWFDF